MYECVDAFRPCLGTVFFFAVSLLLAAEDPAKRFSDVSSSAVTFFIFSVTTYNTTRLRSVRYVPRYTGSNLSVNTRPKSSVRIGMAAIPYRTLRQGSVRTRHRYPTLQYAW